MIRRQPGRSVVSRGDGRCGRTKDLVHWERLPDIKSPTQQRNVVLHP